MDKALNHLSLNDSILDQLIEKFEKPKFEKHSNYYQELASSIISQQLSVKAAAAIEARFKDLFDGTFPAPDEILSRDVEDFRAAGLSYAKARYIQDLAAKIIDGTVKFDHLDNLTNHQVIAELTQVKGIGEWTVHMFLMFCMGRLDVLPYGDLGIRNGITKLYGFDHVVSPDQVKILAQKQNWHPYESVASWYVWQSLDNLPKIDAT